MQLGKLIVLQNFFHDTNFIKIFDCSFLESKKHHRNTQTGPAKLANALNLCPNFFNVNNFNFITRKNNELKIGYY